jgi:hypothetical protein
LRAVLGRFDEAWGWIFALGYLAALYLGAKMYALHFEKR